MTRIAPLSKLTLRSVIIFTAQTHTYSEDQTPKFHVGDKVNLLKGDGSHDGPYLISSITSAEKCTLSLENGEAVGGGEEFDVQKLKRVPGSS